MAPTERNVEWQTSEIIKCLLEDDDEAATRQCEACLYETDGRESDDDTFDPVVVADKLRSIADAMNDDVKFKAALSDLKKAAAQEAVEAAFKRSVEALCQPSPGAEVAQEMQLIRASVAFALYVKKSAPELKNKVQNAMTAYLNRHVGTWVTQQGGWDKVPNV